MLWVLAVEDDVGQQVDGLIDMFFLDSGIEGGIFFIGESVQVAAQLFKALMRNLYAGQEATVRTGHGTTDWFQIGKGFRQGCILSPCLFNLYAECIIRNVGLGETQAGIKIAGRNINSCRFADDTTLMAESEEELRSLVMKVKEDSGKVGLKLNIQKTKIMTSGHITSWQIDGEIVETVADFIFLGSRITADSDYSHEIKRCSLEGKL